MSLDMMAIPSGFESAIHGVEARYTTSEIVEMR